ncbi:MAG: thiamine biosynthesis protein ApbE [Sphingobacteriales bacterium 50-39]|nr:FAD:protein FMN transferase [Sphingobacteriales bacterium]OJW60464.1 MAG: thiamine biosynthesis protein ApbE [Sphingobacteriales bacterium 50-39]
MNVLFWITLLLGQPADTLQPFHLSGHAQGTTWHITYYSTDSTVLSSQIDSILDKIDSSLSLYKPYSLICQFNRDPHGILMDEHMSVVMQQALDTYRTSSGLFDITVQPLVEAWGFSAHKPDAYPDSAVIQHILPCVGSDYLSIQNGYLLKAKPCVHIDLDGIAQGYSVDVLAGFLEQHHITSYLVELGGELRVKGRKPSGERMRVGIEAPPENEFAEAVVQRIMSVDSGAITTSGSYRAWHERGGKKFSHTINPRTGFPADNELISVTVYAKKAIIADAYDNALMAMGLAKAMEFVNNRKDMAAFFIYRDKNGAIVSATSKSFNALLYP